MAQQIILQDTVTQINTLIVEMPSDKLLQERYFPTSEMDIFDSRSLLIDYDNGDRKSGAYLRQGYADGNTTTFFSQTVEPPRIGVSDNIDTISNAKDRMMFEKLCKPQGNIRPTRADAFNGLLKLKAIRCAERVSKSIERLCAMAFTDNAVQFQYDTSPLDSTAVTCDVQFYDPTLLADPQAIQAAVAWGEEGAHPYNDICNAVRALVQHGGRAEDLLMSPDAWQLLLADMKEQGLLENQIHFTLIANERDRDGLFPEDLEYVKVIGDALFDGYRLKIIVYSGGYEDSDGTFRTFLPEKFACVTHPGCGRTLCGAVSKVNPAAVASYEVDAVAALTGKYITTRHVSTESDSVSVRCESVPLPIPNRVWSWAIVSQPEAVEPDPGEGGGDEPGGGEVVGG